MDSSYLRECKHTVLPRLMPGYDGWSLQSAELSRSSVPSWAQGGHGNTHLLMQPRNIASSIPLEIEMDID